jgi:sugar lactone lactonase YvrE
LVEGERLWVLESGSRVVRRLDADGSVSLVAGSSEGGFADGSGAEARIAPLIGVARLGDALVVSDAGNYRLRWIEPADSPNAARVRTLFGTTRLDDTALVAPTGLAVDAGSGLIYVADTGNAAIKVITP